MRILRSHGFDATAGASQLAFVPRAEEAQRIWEHLVYLPVYHGMSDQQVIQLAKLVSDEINTKCK